MATEDPTADFAATPLLEQYAQALRPLAPAGSIELLAAMLGEDQNRPNAILRRLLEDAV